MKLRNLVATAVVAGAMFAPTASMAATVIPTGWFTLNVDSTGNSPEQIFGAFDVNGFAAWGFDLTGTAGTTTGSAISISAPSPLYPLSLGIFQDSNNNGKWDTLTDTLIATSGPVASSAATVVANGLVSGVNYFLGVTGQPGKSYSGEVSAVPLPAAAWLFGSALLGFMGWSNRRKV